MISHKTEGNLGENMTKVSRNALNFNLSRWIKQRNIISFINKKMNSGCENKAGQVAVTVRKKDGTNQNRP